MYTKAMLTSYLNSLTSVHTKRAYTRHLNMLFAGYVTVGSEGVLSFVNRQATMLRDKAISENSYNQSITALNSFKAYCKQAYGIVDNGKLSTIAINSVKQKKYISRELRDTILMTLNEAVAYNSRNGINNLYLRYSALRNLLIYWLLIHGLRRQEIVNLNCSSVQIESSGLWRVEVIGKRNKKRFIFMSNESGQAMKQYLLHNYCTTLHINEDSPLIMSLEFNRLSADYVYQLVKAWFGSDFSPHSLRASQATDMFSQGYDLLSIMKWFGWSNPTTASRYDLRYLEDLKQISKGIN